MKVRVGSNGRKSLSPFPLAGEGMKDRSRARENKNDSRATNCRSVIGYGVFFAERTARAAAATSAMSEPILG